ncbi:MAG: hypothetical protein JW725_04790 [Candidatus Babeliaceae bacterium]|nr:hypothetical protein [Candidatus Babeliaceae bacterium]
MSFVDYLFLGLNAAVLFGVLYYIIRYKIFPELQFSFEQKEKERQELYDNTGRIKKRLDEIAGDRQKQSVLCDELERNILRWQQQIEADQKRKQEELQQRVEEMARLHRERWRLYQIKKLQDRILPEVIKESRTVLEKEFADEEAGSRYLHRLFREVTGDNG